MFVNPTHLYNSIKFTSKRGTFLWQIKSGGKMLKMYILVRRSLYEASNKKYCQHNKNELSLFRFLWQPEKVSDKKP